MKKKILLMIAIMVMAFGLTGCCISHDWAEATCESPKTCKKCGKTEGEALGHEQGSEANYQHGPICSRCGAEIGDKLTADFEQYGFVIADNDTPITYTTITKNGYETVGEVTFHTEDTSATGPNGESIEGYEWVHATLTLRFADESAKNDGVKWFTTTEDYFTIDKYDNSLSIVVEDDENKIVEKQFMVNYDGVDYDQCLVISKFINGGWGDDETYTATYDYEYCVPVGYDGMVVAVMNGATTWEDGQHIYDLADANTIFFKVK